MVASERDISEERSRRTLVIVVAVIAAIAIAGLFYILMRAARSSSSDQPPRLADATRQGSPDWDKYSKLIALDEPEADEARRGLGDIVMTLRTTVRNFTGHAITGLEMRAAVVDHQNNAVRERHVVVIPNERYPQLAPNKTIPVSVVLDGMTDTTDRANIKMEVTGFKLAP